MTNRTSGEQLSLFDLQQSIKEMLHSSFSQPCMVVGEISEIRVNPSNGHCYLVLIEKRDTNDQIIARASATIWNRTFRMIQPYFEQTTGTALAAGMKVLVSALVEYHELYGLSLNIRDIDPTYTLGDMARRRQEVILQLQDEGIFDMNKELVLPELTQRIAVISSATAAGYQDFCNQLETNSNNFFFTTELFSATMQGNGAEQSIINALDNIYDCIDSFDVVVIIRGGGATSDLSCFDSYNLAAHVAQFPLPVISGIGHERDESILDMVANTRVKTPTAAAAFLIDRLAETEGYLLTLEEQFFDKIEEKLNESHLYLKELTLQLPNIVTEQLQNHRYILQKRVMKLEATQNNLLHAKELQLRQIAQKAENAIHNAVFVSQTKLFQLKHRLVNSTDRFIEQKHFALKIAKQTNTLSDPKTILKRGYSITLKDGKSIKDITVLRKGDKITTVVASGKISSRVE